MTVLLHRLPLLLGLPLLACSLPTPTMAATATTSPAIAAGSLETALQQFLSRDSVKLNLLYSPALLAHRRSSGVAADTSPREGLAQLLSGSGITALEVSPNTYLLRAAPLPRPHETGGPPRTSELDAVQVTGSRIPRTTLQSSAPVSVITAEQIRASGSTSVFDVLRRWPGMNPYHPWDVSTNFGRSPTTPLALSSTTGLLALGPQATLFLIDGMRTASFGLTTAGFGSIVPLDSIPLGMIDRIEIVSGSASAVYGSDAMAGVVNIVLKRDYQGAEISMYAGMSSRGDAARHGLTASLGGTTPNGAQWTLAFDRTRDDGLLGSRRSWATTDQRAAGLDDQRIALAAINSTGIQRPADCVGNDVSPSGQPCSLDPPRYTRLVPASESTAAMATYRQPLGEHTELGATLRLAEARSYAQYAPAAVLLVNGPQPARQHVFFDAGPIRLDSDMHDADLLVTLRGGGSRWTWNSAVFHHSNTVINRASGIVDLPVAGYEEQQLIDLGYAFDGSPHTAPLPGFGAENRLRGRYRAEGLSADIGGPLLQLAHGPIEARTGIELRHEHLGFTANLSANGAGYSSYAAYLGGNPGPFSIQALRLSQFGELAIPFARGAVLDLAWRADRDPRFGTSFTPRAGITWTPREALTLRTSYGAGYRVPTLYEERVPSVHPPLAGNVLGLPATPELEPCKLDTSTVPTCILAFQSTRNTALRPEHSRSLTLGLQWSPSTALDLEINHYRIHRRDEIIPYFDASDTASLIRDANGILTGIPVYLANRGRSRVRGWQGQGTWRLDGPGMNQWQIRLQADYLETLRRFSPLAPQRGNLAGYKTPRLHASMELDWRRAAWNLRLAVRHRSGLKADPWSYFEDTPELVLARKLQRDLPAMTTLDLGIGYEPSERWTLALQMFNATDRTPKNYNGSPLGYTVADDDPLGRYFQISATRRF
ncbi:TonB-dependent receptor [Stenotrophomonas maltophilia]|nr:TonB-dependent receptor [Stenotrophomonas maltophilia]